MSPRRACRGSTTGDLWVGERTAGGRVGVAGVASGAEDYLSRLIGMRLLVFGPSYSMGLILEARGVCIPSS